MQRAKKVVCVSPGLVDFAIGLVNSVLNLPEGQVSFLGNSNYRRTVINAAYQKFFGLVKKTVGLVHTSINLSEWQAVKLTFFASCCARLSDNDKTSQAIFLPHD